jgi:hypothetical protein
MKKELLQLEEVVRELGDFFCNKKYITISVIIQNMAFYAEKWEWNQFKAPLRILELMKSQNEQDHVCQWVSDEASMIVDGHFMSMEEDHKIDEDKHVPTKIMEAINQEDSYRQNWL